MNTESRGRWAVWGLLAAGLAARAFYMGHVYGALPPSARFMHADTDGYDRLALGLLERGTYGFDGVPTTSREPFYPLLLAVAHAVFGPSYVVGLALNLVFSGFCLWFVYRLTLSIFADFSVATLALGFSCFYPEWIYFSSLLYRENLLSALLALWAWAWAEREKWGHVRAFFIMGLAFGAIALTRSPMIPVGAAFAAAAALKIPRRLWVKTLGVFFLCAALFQLPWIARNWRLTGRLVPGAGMGGYTMYFSLLYDYGHPEIPLEDSWGGSDPVVADVSRRGLSLEQADPFFYRACAQVFLKRPRLFWSAFFHKTVKLWRPYPSPTWSESYRHSGRLLKVVGLLTNGPLFALAFLGAWKAWRRGYEVWFWLMVPAVMTTVFGAYWAVMRYHTSLVFGFMPLAAYALLSFRKTRAAAAFTP